jgi:hypothetical protein
MKLQEKHNQEQMESFIESLQSRGEPTGPTAIITSDCKFFAFDPSTELWKDYWSRFETFTQATGIPDNRQALIFLSNQSKEIYKLLSTLAEQSVHTKQVNALTIADIQGFMTNTLILRNTSSGSATNSGLTSSESQVRLHRN